MLYILIYTWYIQTYNQLTLFKTLNAITVSTSLSNNGTDYLSISCLCAQRRAITQHCLATQGRYSNFDRLTSRKLAFILFQTIIFIEKNERLACKARARSQFMYGIFLSCSAQLTFKRTHTHTHDKNELCDDGNAFLGARNV